VETNLKELFSKPRPKKFRAAVTSHIQQSCKHDKVAVLLSGGVDSHVALFGALASKKTPVVYSFTLDDRESRDFCTARRTADYFGLEFVPILLPTNIDMLMEYVWNIQHKWLAGYELGKATIECCWPIMHAIHAVKERDILTGFGGDMPYCSSRSAKKQYLAGNYKQYLHTCYFDNQNIQKVFRDEYCKKIRRFKNFVSPLEDASMHKVFSNFDPFVEGNKPIQKAISRAAFYDYFHQVRVYGQQPFQKGDTGIENLFEQLLNTHWHIRGKTVLSIYNAVAKKQVSLKRPPK
jgi:hypothetical protein